MRPAPVGVTIAGVTEDDQRDVDDRSVARLISVGRDREAAALAAELDRRRAASAREGVPDQGGPDMDGVRQLEEIMPLLVALVDNISDEQLGAPTPCAAFTVTSLLEHMIGGASAFAPAFRGEPPSAAPSDPAAPVKERWRAAMADLMSAMNAAGAQERTIASPFGDVSGATFARYVAFDGLIHGWDLATATGQPYAPAEDVVQEIDAFARQLIKPAMRDGTTFAAETLPPAGASVLERLVAFSGREVPA
jgi:uncharacterized protein (TIGR03086 family)